MTLAELIRIGNGLCPECDESVVPSLSTTTFCKADVFNEATREFSKYTLCLPKVKRFNCVASTSSYSLTSNISDYYIPREPGLWHNRSDTATTSWERVDPTTVRNMDMDYPSWRNDSVSDYVDNYWIDGDMLYTHYTPSTTISSGFEMYYYGMSTDMSALTHYPYTGTATEEARLRPYDRALLVYYEYRVLGLLGYKSDAQAKEQEFYMLCEKARNELQNRRDIAQDSTVRPKSYISQMKGMFG